MGQIWLQLVTDDDLFVKVTGLVRLPRGKFTTWRESKHYPLIIAEEV